MNIHTDKIIQILDLLILLQIYKVRYKKWILSNKI